MAIAIAIISSGYSHQILGQATDCSKQQIKSASRQPDLSVDYARVAQFKLISRKTVYHVGEIINLDFAMINISGEPVLFNRLSDPELHIKDAKGREAEITPYFIAESIVNPTQYILLKPWRMTSESIPILLGCDERAFKQTSEGLDDEDDKRAFNENQFKTWGRACLKITHPGNYIITGVENNQYVLTSGCEPNLKTATGAVQSSPLTITIIE
jgi:hypothetical protein